MSILFHHKHFTFLFPVAFLPNLLLKVSIFVLLFFHRPSFHTNDIMITKSKYALAVDFLGLYLFQIFSQSWLQT